MLDNKKGVHLDGSSIGTVSRLERVEGPTGRRVRPEAERARIIAQSLLPGGRRCRRWRANMGRRAGRFTTDADVFGRVAPCLARFSDDGFAPLVVEEPLKERRVPVVA